MISHLRKYLLNELWVALKNFKRINCSSCVFYFFEVVEFVMKKINFFYLSNVFRQKKTPKSSLRPVCSLLCKEFSLKSILLRELDIFKGPHTKIVRIQVLDNLTELNYQGNSCRHFDLPVNIVFSFSPKLITYSPKDFEQKMTKKPEMSQRLERTNSFNNWQ